MIYEEELKKIEEWYWKERNKINQMPPSEGLDGEHSAKCISLNKQLRKKIDKIKEDSGGQF